VLIINSREAFKAKQSEYQQERVPAGANQSLVLCAVTKFGIWLLKKYRMGICRSVGPDTAVAAKQPCSCTAVPSYGSECTVYHTGTTVLRETDCTRVLPSLSGASTGTVLDLDLVPTYSGTGSYLP
jgi:hypothetical protein